MQIICFIFNNCIYLQFFYDVKKQIRVTISTEAKTHYLWNSIIDERKQEWNIIIVLTLYPRFRNRKDSFSVAADKIFIAGFSRSFICEIFNLNLEGAFIPILYNYVFLFCLYFFSVLYDVDLIHISQNSVLFGYF